MIPTSVNFLSYCFIFSAEAGGSDFPGSREKWRPIGKRVCKRREWIGCPRRAISRVAKAT